jgi:replicative DNA helicase
MKVNKLSDFGYSFQIKLISALFKDKVFLQQIIDILDSSYFDSEANIVILDMIKDYFSEYKNAPTLEAMKIKIVEMDNDLLKKTIAENIKAAFANLDAEDLDFVKEKALEFCKNQEIKKAIVNSVELLNNGDYDSIKALVDNALKAGLERNVGHEYKTSVDERYLESVRNTVKTQWEAIDDIADGGLGKGELGVFVAPAGIGKSWALVNVGSAAAKAGLNVIHYTLELNEAYVGLRYDSVMTGIAAQELKYNIEEVKKNVENIKGNLIVKYFPTKGATVNTIASHIERCRANGFPPDMIIVDYADLLRGKGKEVRLELGNIYEDLRGLAGEHEIPVWTASQANRSALEDDIIGAEKIAESYSKIMTADFVVSLSRKIEDKIAGTGRWHVIKNRFGPDGITFPSKMNASNGKIDIYVDTSIQGKETTKEMDNHNEYLRKMMKKKFDEMN